MIFKGIKSTGDCNKNPIVTEVNARERYSDYFDAFFADGGEWRNYVQELVGNKASRLQASGLSQQTYGVVVTVNRSTLLKRLKDDGVLPSDYRP